MRMTTCCLLERDLGPVSTRVASETKMIGPRSLHLVDVDVALAVKGGDPAELLEVVRIGGELDEAARHESRAHPSLRLDCNGNTGIGPPVRRERGGGIGGDETWMDG